MVKEFVEYWEEHPDTFRSSSIKWDTTAPHDGEHVLVGDPTNPPPELEHGQLMWDGDADNNELSLIARIEQLEARLHRIERNTQ